jgi:hypothetical protein
VQEISGADTSSPLDQCALNFQATPGTGSNAVTSGSVTTTTDGQFIFGASRGNVSSQTVTHGTSPNVFTADYEAGAARGLLNEHFIQSTQGAIAATGTSDTGGAINQITGIMTFKAAAAGFTLVTHIGAQSSDGISATTAGINTTGATLLVAAVARLHGASASLSDSKGNAWLALTTRDNASAYSVTLYYVLNPTVGASHTFSTNVGGGSVFPAHRRRLVGQCRLGA